MATKQETLDLVAKHLLQQNAQSMHPEKPICAYRGCNGMKCAIGVLIPDELCTEDLEGLDASHPRIVNLLRDQGHNVALCADLQLAHDSCQPSQWPQALITVAEVHNVSPTVILSHLEAQA